MLNCRRPRLSQASSGSTAKGWPGWPTGRGPGGPARRTAADQPDRRPALPPRTVDRAPDPAVPGVAAGQRAHAVPRVRLVATWRRPKLTARGDPAHDQVVAGIVAGLPRRAVVLAEDETHLNLARMCGPAGSRKVTVLGRSR
jgi:hypothetical protein